MHFAIVKRVTSRLPAAETDIGPTFPGANADKMQSANAALTLTVLSPFCVLASFWKYSR